MSLPNVILTELDGALGILPTTAGKILSVLGVSSAGTVAAPATYARVSDLTAAFGDGPGVEAAAIMIEKFGKPVQFTRTGQTTAGSYPAGASVVRVGAGTSVATVDNVGTSPWDDYEFFIKIVTGGTVGTAGITLSWSLDGGRTFSPVTALGTAVDFTFPGSGGTMVEFAAGTLLANETVSFVGKAPKWNTTEIGAALDAVFASSVAWENAFIVGDLEAADIDVIDPKFTAALAVGKYRGWFANTRMPDVAESEATYLAALSAAFESKATVHGEICAAAAKTVSSVSGRRYRRPVAFTIAPFIQSVSEEVNVADVNLGSLPGVSIRDANGNPDEHDESINPGLDDARFTVLRTWAGLQGIYVNRPRVFSAAGSDFDIFPKRRVINITHEALRIYFIRRLNKPIRVSATTGFILEAEALEIESGARAAMRSVLLAKPKASAVQFTLSRTDNILSTKTLTGQARVVPLAYPEFMDLSVGFLNPALQVQAV